MTHGSDTDGIRGSFRLRDVGTALALLTRLPLPGTGGRDTSDRPMAAAAWAYPLVGLVVAVAGAMAGGVLSWFGAAPYGAALFAVGVQIVLTGAMHEDGLADCADGFWGGWEPARRLEIMKDSQIGTYGVLALVGALVLRWMIVAQLIEGGVLLWGLAASGVASRAAMVWQMHRLPHARAGGLSRMTGRPDRPAALAALAIGLGAVLMSPGPVLGVVALTAATTLAWGLLARRKVGGQTGDVLGATQQLAELAVLLTLSLGLTTE